MTPEELKAFLSGKIVTPSSPDESVIKTAEPIEKAPKEVPNRVYNPISREKTEILNRMQGIRDEFGGKISDIPINHEYYALKARLNNER